MPATPDQIAAGAKTFATNCVVCHGPGGKGNGPLAATLNQPFAAKENVTDGRSAPHWADSVSHGELLRTGVDQKMEVDPRGLKFLIQGALQSQIQGKPYGEIPWRLGLLELAP